MVFEETPGLYSNAHRDVILVDRLAIFFIPYSLKFVAVRLNASAERFGEDALSRLVGEVESHLEHHDDTQITSTPIWSTILYEIPRMNFAILV